ncbi:uncharacterized protein PAC_08046 [Phialocephala subalpina]|uniref:C2H2-type domain-containing protein n=1 Tax=Phialocephala subalpina TaxID=576137 RepID=A0A1L7WZF1_9HELO|nr:uncharacterized protein PAC_08046 [Phialocephala subalpina]
MASHRSSFSGTHPDIHPDSLSSSTLPFRPDDQHTSITGDEDGGWVGEEEGKEIGSCVVPDHWMTNTQTAVLGGLTYPSSMYQQATYNQHLPATSQVPHHPRTHSNIWNDTIRYGSSADSIGEPLGFQSPLPTTFPFHDSQYGDNFDFSDLENDFLFFDEPTTFGPYPAPNSSQPDVLGAPLQNPQTTYDNNSPGSEAYAPDFDNFFSCNLDNSNDYSQQPEQQKVTTESPQLSTNQPAMTGSRLNPPVPSTQLNTTRFNCAVPGCRASYKRRYELYRHRLVHTGVKNHACHFVGCNKAAPNGFARKDHLKQHLGQVHGV